MGSQDCAFFEKSLEEGNTVKIYPKGCDTKNQANDKRGGNIEVKKGDRLHTNAGGHTHRGSYMSAHVLLNLLNELRKRDQMRGLPSILSLFRDEFNKFNNTRAQM